MANEDVATTVGRAVLGGVTGADPVVTEVFGDDKGVGGVFTGVDGGAEAEPKRKREVKAGV